MSEWPAYDRTDTQCQPCDNFTPRLGYYGLDRHYCPWCESPRVWCEACYCDHHAGGGQKCPWNRQTCQHPACIAAEAAMTPEQIEERRKEMEGPK